MRQRLALAALLAAYGAVPCHALDGARDLGSLPVTSFSGGAAALPRDLRNVLTFQADLLTDDQPGACRGSSTPTRSGGVMSGGATLYEMGASGFLTPCPQSGGCYGPDGVWALGAIGNSLLWSNAFTASSWGNARLNVSTNGPVLGPDGVSSTTNVLCEDGNNGSHCKAQNVTGTASTKSVVAVNLHAGGRSWAYIHAGEVDGSAYIQRFFGLTGTGWIGSSVQIGSATNWFESSSSIKAIGGGWYLCVLVTGTPSGTGRNVRFGIANADASASYSGDNSSSLFIWGASVWDAGTFQYPGHLMTGATAGGGARTADAGPTYAAAGNVRYAPNGTISLTITSPVALGINQRPVGTRTGNDGWFLFSSGNGWGAFFYDAAGSVATLASPAGSVLGATQRVSFSAAPNLFQACMNGSSFSAPDTSGVYINGLLPLSLGDAGSSSYSWTTLRDVAYYAIGLSGADLSASARLR